MADSVVLFLSNYRLAGNPYHYIHSLLPKNPIVIKFDNPDKTEEPHFKPMLLLSPEQKITSGPKILEYLWLKASVAHKKVPVLNFSLASKDFLEVFALYEYLFEVLSHKELLEKKQLKELVEKFNSLKINEIWYENPPLAMVLYESLYALKHLDPSFLNKKNPLTKFVRMIEINPLFQSFLYMPETLLKPIGPYQGSQVQLVKDKITANLSSFIDFAALNNALYTYESNGMTYWDHIPFSGFPTLQIQKKELETLREKSLIWNKLFDRMVRRIHIFEKIFEDLGQVDMFVSRLWKISQQKKSLGKNKGIEFCIFRNDYMRDGVLDEWKQIEYNAIAVSFGYMSDSVQKLHHIIYNQVLKAAIEGGNQLACLPESSILLADGLAHAHKLYGKHEAKILFIISNHEGNILDQRGLELLLGYRGVLVVRSTFEEIIKKIRVDEKHEDRLYIENQEISVVYYRHGYQPNHYLNEDYWKVREMMEFSKALKCPSVEFQLINFKKIQEVLQRKNILSELLDTQEEIDAIYEDFVQILSLDNSKEQSIAFDLVKSNPEDYVLKPQREGGGNNTYGLDIIEKFKSAHASSELKAFILMRKIKPTPRPGFLIKKRKLEISGVISELGVYSYLISDPKVILESRHGGYLLRTKNFETDEGGVATGYSVLDSLIYGDEE